MYFWTPQQLTDVYTGGACEEGLCCQRRLGDLPVLRGPGAGHPDWPATTAPLLSAIVSPGAERRSIHRPRVACVRQRGSCEQPRPQQVPASGGYIYTDIHTHKNWLPHPAHWMFSSYTVTDPTCPLFSLEIFQINRLKIFEKCWILFYLFSFLCRVLVWCWWRRLRELPEMNMALENWLLSRVRNEARFGVIYFQVSFNLTTHCCHLVYNFSQKILKDWNFFYLYIKQQQQRKKIYFSTIF